VREQSELLLAISLAMSASADRSALRDDVVVLNSRAESEAQHVPVGYVNTSALVALMKDFERTDIATELLLKCLDSWRVLSVAEGPEAPA
jgi:hypothetical protein